MGSSRATGQSLRRQLVSAAQQLRPAEALRLLEKRAAPLTRQGENLGSLSVLLRLTFQADAPARGVLVFEWPNTAATHAIVAGLERWSGRFGDRSNRHGKLELARKPAPSDENGEPCTHLNIGFSLADLTEETDLLWDIVARVGLAGAVPRLIEAPPMQAAKPDLPQVTMDAIAHNAVFDPAAHPRVGINDEVTNSAGITFRLITKRIDGQRCRVWIRVAGLASSVTRAG